MHPITKERQPPQAERGARGDECLVVAFGACGPRVARLPPRPDSVVLGRAPEGAVNLGDPLISRRHAEVSAAPGGPVLRDLGSTNGTWVNGDRLVGARPLRRGDVVRLGDTLLIVAPDHADLDAAGPPAGPVGRSLAMREVLAQIAAVAGRPNTVVITGETGTGKEVIAQAIHAASGRPRLVSINCGALVEGVLESELFGHVRGAFTGATEAREGLFRAASGGTLFLDEIGELPPGVQVRLLRALESRAVRPVGGTSDVPVDVRVIAATNRDLGADVRAGRFRADLYARLVQWTIALPPLRERREDIPLLCERLLARLGQPGRPVAPELGEALLRHPWPLNVRGLFNALAVAATDARDDGPLGLRPAVVTALAAQRSLVEPDERGRAAPDGERLAALLGRHRGKVAAAARELRVTRQQIYRWLAAHGLSLSELRAGAKPTPG